MLLAQAAVVGCGCGGARARGRAARSAAAERRFLERPALFAGAERSPPPMGSFGMLMRGERRGERGRAAFCFDDRCFRELPHQFVFGCAPRAAREDAHTLRLLPTLDGTCELLFGFVLGRPAPSVWGPPGSNQGPAPSAKVRLGVRRRPPESGPSSSARLRARAHVLSVERVLARVRLRRRALKSVRSRSSPHRSPRGRTLLQQHERPADERSEGRERRALGPTKNHDARRGDVRRQDRRADRRQVEVAGEADLLREPRAAGAPGAPPTTKRKHRVRARREAKRQRRRRRGPLALLDLRRFGDLLRARVVRTTSSSRFGLGAAARAFLAALAAAFASLSSFICVAFSLPISAIFSSMEPPNETPRCGPSRTTSSDGTGGARGALTATPSALDTAA